MPRPERLVQRHEGAESRSRSRGQHRQEDDGHHDRDRPHPVPSRTFPGFSGLLSEGGSTGKRGRTTTIPDRREAGAPPTPPRGAAPRSRSPGVRSPASQLRTRPARRFHGTRLSGSGPRQRAIPSQECSRTAGLELSALFIGRSPWFSEILAHDNSTRQIGSGSGQHRKLERHRGFSFVFSLGPPGQPSARKPAGLAVPPVQRKGRSTLPEAPPGAGQPEDAAAPIAPTMPKHFGRNVGYGWRVHSARLTELTALTDDRSRRAGRGPGGGCS